jgi:hypothetical protein
MRSLPLQQSQYNLSVSASLIAFIYSRTILVLFIRLMFLISKDTYYTIALILKDDKGFSNQEHSTKIVLLPPGPMRHRMSKGL